MPNRGKITSTKSACDFFGLLYCVVVLLCKYLSWPLHNIIFHTRYTPMAKCSQFVLKVPLNTSQPATTLIYADYVISGYWLLILCWNMLPPVHCIGRGHSILGVVNTDTFVYGVSYAFLDKMRVMFFICLWMILVHISPPPFRLAASVSWCWSWEKEGRAVEVVPGI